MATVQLEFSDDDIELFTKEASLEGMSLSEWVSWAVHARIRAKYGRKMDKRKKPPDSLKELFKRIDEMHGPDPEPEPDWEEHLRVMNESRERGAAPT